MHSTDNLLRIRVKNLFFSYLYAPVLTNISCDLNAGCALIIRGKNGAGKSTFLRLIAGILTPTSGTIDFSGFKKKLSFLGHLNAIKPGLTVQDQLHLSLKINGIDCPPSFMEKTIETYGLHSQMTIPAGLLSAGFQRRVALVQLVLTGQNKVWVLDEPFTNLDDKTVALFTETLNSHIMNGGSAFLSSHTALSLINSAEFWLND